MTTEFFQDAGGRWPAEKAQLWNERLGWQCGFNYLPQTAVNFLDMWLAQSFDIALIEKELTWARDAGFNSLRTNLPYIVWVNDRDGLIHRVDQFLSVAADLGFSVMLCPLDDCEFSGLTPKFEAQPKPLPGIHNSRALGSPGRHIVTDFSAHAGVLDYIRDLVSHFAQDSRVTIWDLYNEPGNPAVFSTGELTEYQGRLQEGSLALMKAVFATARACQPSQPLTVGSWRIDVCGEEALIDNEIDQVAMDLSDVITFHAYTSLPIVEKIVHALNERYRRPIMITEWMARHAQSFIPEQLPYYRKNNIACYQWGLVEGATQTYIPWPHMVANSDDASLWFHDFFRSDGAPYSEEEAQAMLEQSQLR